MKIYEIIENSLYHFMSPDKALDVFSNNKIKGNWVHDIPGIGKINGNSLTRNKRFVGSANNRFIRLSLNKNKLQIHNKIIPLDAERIFTYTRKGNDDSVNPPKFSDIDISDRKLNKSNKGIYSMAEEFVIGDINNLNQVLIKIEIVENNDSGWNTIINKNATIAAEQFSKKFNIPFIDGRPPKNNNYSEE